MHLLTAREQTYYATHLPIPTFTFGLLQDIDKQALEDAIQRALPLHPIFGMNIVRGKSGLFEFVPLESPSLDETHHSLWNITCSGRFLRFDGAHALTDGSGVLRFLCDVLAYYLRSIGHRTIPEPILNPVNLDLSSPYDRLINQSFQPLGLPNFGPPALTDERFFDQTLEHANSQHVSLSFSEIKNCANICETTVFSVISAYLARAYQKAFHLDSGNIKIRVAANIRPHLHIDTPRNFSMGFPLNYDIDRMQKLENEMVFSAFRSQLDICLEEGNLLKKCQSEHKHLLDFLQNPAKLDDQTSFYRNYTQSWAYISYTHLKPNFIPEIEAHLDSFQWHHDTFHPKWLCVACATSLHDKIEVCIEEYTKDNTLAKAFQNALKTDGFSCNTHPNL